MTFTDTALLTELLTEQCRPKGPRTAGPLVICRRGTTRAGARRSRAAGRRGRGPSSPPPAVSCAARSRPGAERLVDRRLVPADLRLRRRREREHELLARGVRGCRRRRSGPRARSAGRRRRCRRRRRPASRCRGRRASSRRRRSRRARARRRSGPRRRRRAPARAMRPRRVVIGVAFRHGEDRDERDEREQRRERERRAGSCASARPGARRSGRRARGGGRRRAARRGCRTARAGRGRRPSARCSSAFRRSSAIGHLLAERRVAVEDRPASRRAGRSLPPRSRSCESSGATSASATTRPAWRAPIVDRCRRARCRARAGRRRGVRTGTASPRPAPQSASATATSSVADAREQGERDEARGEQAARRRRR